MKIKFYDEVDIEVYREMTKELDMEIGTLNFRIQELDEQVSMTNKRFEILQRQKKSLEELDTHITTLMKSPRDLAHERELQIKYNSISTKRIRVQNQMNYALGQKYIDINFKLINHRSRLNDVKIFHQLIQEYLDKRESASNAVKVKEQPKSKRGRKSDQRKSAA